VVAARKVRTEKSRRGARWTVAELEQLGASPDSLVAHRWGRTIKEVVAMRERMRIALETGPRRWTRREIKLLGTLNDHELARRLRRPKHEVHRQRRALGIAPFKPRPKWRNWKASEKKLLGTMTDAEVARKLRRTPTSVQVERIRLRIPIFNPGPNGSPSTSNCLGQCPMRNWPSWLAGPLQPPRPCALITPTSGFLAATDVRHTGP
jgi:hypothetical protein